MKRHNVRSRLALWIAPWLADSMSQESMRFYRQHFNRDGGTKRRWPTERAAKEAARTHQNGYRAYRCQVCREWHITSKVGLAIRAQKLEKDMHCVAFVEAQPEDGE
jgi:hypothetical protein